MGRDSLPIAVRSLPSREELNACRRCDLWRRATQSVGGEGSSRAKLMFVGEQPGDQEDLEGRPFVGPAGQLLRSLIETAGIDSRAIFVTNAVKHFSWEARGKRRLHKTPAQREMEACSVWLDREIEAISPKVIVALGATALASLMGSRMAVNAARKTVLHHTRGARIVATFHPSAVLRVPDQDAKASMRADMLEDLGNAWRLVT